MAVTAARRAAHAPGPQGLPPHRGRRRPRPPRTGRRVRHRPGDLPLPRRTGHGIERPETAERRGLVRRRDRRALVFHGALRRSEVAAHRWADVDLSAGDDDIVTLRRSKTNRAVERVPAPDRRLRRCRPPPPRRGGGGDQVNRRFAAVRRGRPRGLLVRRTVGASTSPSSSPPAERLPAPAPSTPPRRVATSPSHCRQPQRQRSERTTEPPVSAHAEDCPELRHQ